jgi:hypothetical protein
MGLGYGDLLVIPGADVYGEEANRAFVLGEDVADGGELLVTSQFLEALGELPDGIGAQNAPHERESDVGFAWHVVPRREPIRGVRNRLADVDARGCGGRCTARDGTGAALHRASGDVFRRRTSGSRHRNAAAGRARRGRRLIAGDRTSAPRVTVGAANASAGPRRSSTPGTWRTSSRCWWVAAIASRATR